MALGFWAKDYLGPKETGGGGDTSTYKAGIERVAENQYMCFGGEVEAANIINAVTAGKLVYFVTNKETWLCVGVTNGNAIFTRYTFGSTSLSCKMLTLSSTGSCSLTSKNITFSS